MPTTIDQLATATPTIQMGWANPPADVTNAIEGLRQHCEAWPKSPTENPLHLVSGTADAICSAVTGHALFVPDGLANSIIQVGTFMTAVIVFGLIGTAVSVGIVFYLWAKFFGKPKPVKRPPDVLTSVVLLLGWFVWLFASGLARRYSPGGELVFIAAALMCNWLRVSEGG